MLLFTLASMALLASGVSAASDQAADEAAIRKATETRQAAANEKDVKTYLSFIDEECTAGWDGNPCAGAIRASGEFPAAVINAQARIFEGGDIVFVTPDVAIFRYTVEQTGFLNADGTPRPAGTLQRVELHERKDGRWVLVAGGLTRSVD